MPRSSRHKYSKHNSREARDCSDSEKDYGLKEKKGKEDGGSSSSSRHLKESASGEKRKLESKSVDIAKETIVTTNVEYTNEYGPSSLSKKRKEKVDDDRWTGGNNNVHELSKSEVKEMKSSSDSKRSSRRDENLVSGIHGEEGKRSGSKIESKHHHRSDRKDKSEKEGGFERERKSSKSEKLVDGGVSGADNFGSEINHKHSVVNTDVKRQVDSQKPDSERELDRRGRRKRDGSGDEDKHQDGIRELDDRRLSSRNDIVKLGRHKDDGHKDERARDKYREDSEKDYTHQDEKKRGSWPSRDNTSGRSDDKQVRNENKDLDVSQKKSKLHHSEYDRDRDRNQDRDRDRDRDYDRDRNRGRDRDRNRGRHGYDREHDREHDDRENDLDRDRDRDRDLERDHDRDRELDRERERGRDPYHRDCDRDKIHDRDRNRDRGRDRDYDYDHDHGFHVDDKSSRYKEDRGRRRSPDGFEEYHGDKESSLSRKARVDSVTSSSRLRNSPNSRSYVGTDKYRDGMQDEVKNGDTLRDGASLSEAVDKVPKYRSGEKHAKFDDNQIAELHERSPSTKASPVGLKERSPSSTSVDRRIRTGRRRSLDIDEAERRSSGSNDIRDVSFNEDKQGRDFSAKKSMGEDYPPAESSFYHKSSQGNVSSHGLGHGPTGFRARADSPSFIGSSGEENRGHSGNRYRRSADSNMGRVPGNSWKGLPNWPSPLPNGFMPFPPGPPGPHHSGFPPIFPPLFGVRPSLEMNHPGMPYHMADADRFPGHVRPMGWLNMVDGSVPPHFHHGWDGNNGVLRDESSIYGPGHLSGARGRDVNSDMWKPNGDVNMDVTSGSQKDAPMVKASTDEASSAQGASRPYHESSCLDDQGTSLKKNTSSGLLSAKEIPMTPTKTTTEKTPESVNVDDIANYLPTYLAKLDISIDLSDPELYNQCISIDVKGQTEYVEEDVELEYMEDKAGVEPDITYLNMGLTYFPAAKDSIFQRAMGLYKNQSTGRRTNAMSNGEKLLSPPAEASQLEAKQIMVPKERVDTTNDYSLGQENPALMVSKVVPTIGEQKEKHPLHSAEMAPDVGTETETPALCLEKTEEKLSAELILENADKVDFPVDSTIPNAIGSTADVEIVGTPDAIDSGADVENVGADGKNGINESASDEQLDVSVSDAIILSHDSVKVCEALMPVSNESESVILSRIHHASESTH